jgi:serine protease Do
LRRTFVSVVLAASLSTSAVWAQDVDASRRTAIVRASERMAPAVVSVNVLRRETVQPRSLFESFFLGPGTTRQVQGLGSGFVIRNDGVVVTNEHVVRDATEVVVTLSDGRDFAADVVGTDEVTDLAVLRLRSPPQDLAVAPLGTSSNLIIGEWAIAIGNPFGFYLANAEPTVTAGVISAIGRNIIPGGDESKTYYLDMIQTDASINPGNSGGPLVNALGEVIGVNSSILSQSGGSIGLGFAIPIDRARRVVADLISERRVRRTWTGITVEPEAPNQFGRSHAIRVAGVAAGSPGARAGVAVGDVIESVGGRRVSSLLDWEARLLDARVGEALTLAVRRAGNARAVQVTPADLPSLGAERVRALANLELITLTPAIRSERHLTNERGALIVSLSEDARQIGLAEGDLILEINRVPIGTAAEAANTLRSLAGRGSIRITFERHGRIASTSFYIRG